jgi:CheY-like chemotaxis protein
MDVAGRIRSERLDADVILLTADEELVSIASRLGVERLHCIGKPFDLETLRQAAGVAMRAVCRRSPPQEQCDVFGQDYTNLVSELERQNSQFERRIVELERNQTGHTSAPDSAPPTEPDQKESSTTASDSEAPESCLPDGLRVLVVDDDPLVRRAMARTFRRHHVTAVENGVAATRALEQSEPDVIVSDLRMPEMDGLALAEEVKRRWPQLAERIVFVSGTGSQIERAEAAVPSRPVLRKPVGGRVLEARIAEVLEHAMRTRGQ